MTDTSDTSDASATSEVPGPAGPGGPPQGTTGPEAVEPRGRTEAEATSPFGWTAPERPRTEGDEDAAGWSPAPDSGSPRHRRGRGRGRRKERDRVRSAIEWVAVIVGALVVALIVKTFLFQAFYIPSASMEPTLGKGDRVLVNKLSYDLHDVNRGDIVVFELPPEKVGADGIKDLIKRVVGLPGETIESIDGEVYIDDELLEEPYLPEGTTTDSPAIERQTVPEDHIFVMGDNRDNSMDSRYPTRGPIPIDTIVGRAFVQVWPPGDVGGL